jgi:ribulose-5-phosphate 4-epimerase/fuculose-1-phosphate aldolase
MLKSEDNFIIGISGPSGVGKTTIANLISLLFKDGGLILSGDDLHKWERNSEKWNTYTHFNPDANELILGYKHILDLKNNIPIERSRYSHLTGKFEPKVKINPSKTVIYEGLHALYDQKTIDIIDLKIYVDTNEDLTKEWKIKRDTQHRGYSKNQVVDVIERRKIDQSLYINPQKKNADVIVKFFKNNDEEIELDYFIINENFNDFMIRLSDLYYQLQRFIFLSKNLSTDISLTQSTGGNISIKKNDILIIKSSGYAMSSINMFGGYSICENINEIPKFENENLYDEFIKNLVYNNKKPSMEVGFHLKLKDNVVIHTHPVYLNTILCSNESKEIIKKLFDETEFSCEYIEYVTPGYELSNIINNKKHKSIYFLENHGLIVTSDNILGALTTTKAINNRCKEWIDGHIEMFVDSDNTYQETIGPLFPDAIILKEELKNINKYMLDLMKVCYLTPRFLNDNEITKLLNLNSEKYRRQIL